MQTIKILVFTIMMLLLSNSAIAQMAGDATQGVTSNPSGGISVFFPAIETPTPAPTPNPSMQTRDTESIDEPSQLDAKIYLTDGQVLSNITIDATGFMHGVEMATPGKATLENVRVINAGTPGFLTPDGRHGDGRGVVVSHAGAHIDVIGGSSNDNSEDGYRVIQGSMNLFNVEAVNNGKNGAFVGSGGDLYSFKSNFYDNKYGVLGAGGFKAIRLYYGSYHNNLNEGIHVIEGEFFTLYSAQVNNNNTVEEQSEDRGGISIFGVQKVHIEGTEVIGNYASGIFATSDTRYHDSPVRAEILNSNIRNNGEASITSRGNSQITISGGDRDGKCLELPDAVSNQMGIITVDGEGVDGNSDCP